MHIKLYRIHPTLGHDLPMSQKKKKPAAGLSSADAQPKNQETGPSSFFMRIRPSLCCVTGTGLSRKQVKLNFTNMRFRKCKTEFFGGFSHGT